MSGAKKTPQSTSCYNWPKPENQFKVVTSDEFACSGDFHTDVKTDEKLTRVLVCVLNTDSKYIRYH